MSKSKTPSFVLELKLNTSPSDEHELDYRFYVAFLVKNRLIRHVREALSSMRQDKEYRSLISEYVKIKDKTDPVSKRLKNELGDRLSEIRMSYGLSEYQFHEWIATQQHRYKAYLDSMTCQKIATSVWKSVEDVLFHKGKSIHFQKLDTLNSLEGKNNASGIRFKNGRLHWNGLVIQPQIRKGDVYAREALSHKVKYCRIVRRAMGITCHYYLQLILEGIPPQKHEFIDGRVGIDQGTSSETVFSGHGCILTELAPERPDIEQQATRLSRKMDRSRRATNPDHYNPDGTIKRIKKPWVKSKTYRHDQMRLKTIRRRNAATVKQAEQILVNEILCNHGTDIITEPMDYKALQLRSKEDKLTKDGRHRSKKRFGKSLAAHAPARFMNIMEQKLSYIDKTVFYVDIWKFKASKYDHVLGDYTESPLSARSKMIGDSRVQRDLYSAFLLWCAKDDATIDRDLCFEAFPLFLSFQGAYINKLLSDGKKHSLSFGLKDFAA